MVLFQKFRASKRFAVIVVTSAVFTDTLIYSLVIPLLPSILSKRVRVGDSQLETWISIMLGSYGAAQLLSPAIVGPLTDRFKSKKAPFTLGLLVLIAATVLFFFGQHLAVLVVARVLHGVSTTLVLTSGMTLLSLQFGGKKGGSAIGIAMTGSTGGDLIGPAIGGLMYDAYGEMGVFAVAAGAVGVDIILRLLMLDPPPKPEDPKNEPPLLAEERSLLQDSQHEEGTGDGRGADSEPQPIAVTSVFNEEQLGYRVLLTNAKFLASLSALWIGNCVQAGLETTIPLFISRRFNWSEAQAGLMLLVISAPGFLPISLARLKPRWPTTIALIIMGLMYIAMGFTTSDTTLVKVIFGLLMLGMGFGLFLISTLHVNAVAVIASETEKRGEDDDPRAKATTSSGKAFALMNQALAAGLLIGPVWAGPLDDRFGWLPMCASFAGICMLTSGVIAFSWRK